jgi:hypothetical protein
MRGLGGIMTKARQKKRKMARAAGLTKQKIPVFPPLTEEEPAEERGDGEPLDESKAGLERVR